MTNGNAPLLKVDSVTKAFPARTGSLVSRRPRSVKAVTDVSFEVKHGETLGIVGESGCGKSTLARCIMRLHDVTSGRIVFQGRDITNLPHRRMRAVRRDLMMVFQDPFGSLDPRQRIGSIIAEPIQVHNSLTPDAVRREVQGLLERVGLSADHYNRFPHEFSGGQRQRIGIARALAVRPKLIVCDEPVSALDVSVQAQILNLLKDLQEDFGLTYVFIAHDLDVVRRVSDRVLVMYLGRLVEQGSKDQLYRYPHHPYTASLLAAVPVADPVIARTRTAAVLEGDVPSPLNPPTGCHFHPRCPRAQERCSVEAPTQRLVAVGHNVACHHPLDDWPEHTAHQARSSGGSRPMES